NIGHTLTAAGIAGVLKLVLALRNRQLPPTIHFEQLNEHIDLSDSPFYVNDRLRDWDLDGAQVRQAAISSFGFSGTNAHIVIGEHPVRIETTRARVSPCIVPLSARTAEQLGQKARDLLTFVRENPSVDIAAIAYTLQVGRVAMDERLGFVVDSVEQLADKLEAYLEGRRHAENIQHGQARKNRESIGILSQDEEMREAIVEKLLAQRKLTKLLSLWVRGLDFDWTRLYGEVRPRRITLPVYPFARERYWVEAPPSFQTSSRAAHPLLHRNVSDLTEQRYVSSFTGTELFLADHRVRTEANSVVKVLPGVAYLEMARAAIGEAWPRQLESRTIEIHDTLWLKPVVVEEPAEISIALFAAEDQTVDYEIYSTVDGEPSVHCQGQVAFVARSAPPKLDLQGLRRQMSETELDGPAVYAMFAAMGLHYGPAHQGIAAVHVGNRQALADLRLPAVAEHGQDAYVLHPSLMDSALQASIGLLVDPRRVPENPAVPFALDSIRIFAACTREMAAWVRHAADSREGDVKLDIDLCDGGGNVCVQMRGFALRTMDDSARALADQAAESAASFDEEYYDKLIGGVLAGEMSVDEALDRS
ncbi:MAG TPA: polyketide synthase dehydratase domain-containing protein, partial [Thermoanaerobaculia bacterium]|nr:polyketide synthase dehydratase domain-containing protein [Thermoanaerobaculia bacterium]